MADPGHKTAQALARPARIVLLASEGLTSWAICDRLGLSPHIRIAEGQNDHSDHHIPVACCDAQGMQAGRQ